MPSNARQSKSMKTESNRSKKRAVVTITTPDLTYIPVCRTDRKPKDKALATKLSRLANYELEELKELEL